MTDRTNPSLYFDYNATTPVAPEVLTEMYPYFSEYFANPSSLHHLSRYPAKAMRRARKQTAAFLGVKDENQIIFTSGGSESNNLAIRSALATSGKREIITSAVEHSSVLKLCFQLEKEGCRVKRLGVNDQGHLNIDELKNTLSDQTALVTLMYANNETGVFFPIQEIGKILAEKKILFHVDAVQCVGKMPIQFESLNADYLSLSGHKFYGPKGIGALIVRQGIPVQSLLIGGSQERGRRAGTENVPGIVGLGAACELLSHDLVSETKRIESIRNLFEEKVLGKISGVLINGDKLQRLVNTSSLCFEGVESETLLMGLDQKGICVSSGSACMSGANEPSHVLKAMGYSDVMAGSVIRFSFGRFTTVEEIHRLVEELESQVHFIRSVRKKLVQQNKVESISI